jgi:hypothetical protein
MRGFFNDAGHRRNPFRGALSNADRRSALARRETRV